MFIKICSVVCVGIFLMKILKDAETKHMLAFAFGLSFVFGYVCNCILSYFLWKNITDKIITEADLTIRNYESTVSHKCLHFEKTPKKKYEWCKHNLMTYIGDLKYDNFVKNMRLLE